MAETKLNNQSDNLAKVMLITANVGSIFEDPKVLLKIWIHEFLAKIKEQKPDFLAIHCQEVGGKNYEESMIHVEDFIRRILESDELSDYDKVCILLDEDFTSTVQFTALGNIYFIHKSVTDLKIFDFEKKEYNDLKGHVLHTGNIENVSIKEKSKFPQDFFPECKWSRKGFMRTRWNLNGTQFDLVNIHLFHDANNLIALKESPSPYCKNRHNALKYTLDRFISDEFEKVPCFLFGDLNFRLDISTIVKKLTADCKQINSEETGKKESILFKNIKDKVCLTLGQKVFDFNDSDKTFYDIDNLKWLSEHDNELNEFKDLLFELPKSFPPSYPFTEDSLNSQYMKTRCPSWCDRVIFTKEAYDLVKTNNDSSSLIYDMIGLGVPMGDHKPIFIKFYLPIQTSLNINLKANEQTENKESTSNLNDDSGKELIMDDKLELDKPIDKLTNNLDNNKKLNSKKARQRRKKNSQKKKNEQKPQSNNQINTKQNSNQVNNKNNNNNNKLKTHLNNPIKSTDIKNDKINSKGDNSKKLPPIPLRHTMSIPELMSNSNEMIKTRRLQLINKKNHSTSFDQEKIRPRIHVHTEEWYLKTEKLFNYTKFNTQNDLKYLNDTNDLGKLRKDSLNEHYWSTRLTSHHSSSSEDWYESEWYREIHEKLRINNDKTILIDKLNSDNMTNNQLVNCNNIVNKIIEIDNKIKDQNKLNDIKNDCLNHLDKSIRQLNLDDNKENKLDNSEEKKEDVNTDKINELVICPCLEIDKIDNKSDQLINDSQIDNKLDEIDNLETHDNQIDNLEKHDNKIQEESNNYLNSNNEIKSNDISKSIIDKPIESTKSIELNKESIKIENNLKTAIRDQKKNGNKKSKKKLSKIGNQSNDTKTNQINQNDLEKLSLNENESNSNVNTRYVKIDDGQKISVFRETAV